MSSTTGKVIDTLYSPVVAGLIGWAIGPMIIGVDRSDIVPVAFNWSTATTIGAATAVGTGAGTILKDWILPSIPGNSMFANNQGLILTPALSGAATAAILYPTSDGTNTGMFLGKAFLAGALSTAAADYIKTSVLAPYLPAY